MRPPQVRVICDFHLTLIWTRTQRWRFVLKSRNAKKKELSGYASVGVIGASVDFGVFNLLVQIGRSTILASLVSVALAGVTVFFGNLRVRFRHVAVASKA
jgi:putative flippase GtrA